jgi:uncharacterized protein YdaT
MSSHKETEHAPATHEVAPAKKHKKKHSNTALRSIHELDTGWNKAALKIAKGVQEGLETYVHASKASSEKKDSTLHEVIENHSKALRKALPIVAEAPADLLDSIADMKVVRDIFHKKDKDDDDDDE